MIIQVRISAVPVKALRNTARAAVQGVKTFTENGLDAASFFNNWIKLTYNIPNFNFDLLNIFAGLITTPDSMGISNKYLRKNKV